MLVVKGERGRTGEHLAPVNDTPLLDPCALGSKYSKRLWRPSCRRDIPAQARRNGEGRRDVVVS